MNIHPDLDEAGLKKRMDPSSSFPLSSSQDGAESSNDGDGINDDADDDDDYVDINNGAYDDASRDAKMEAFRMMHSKQGLSSQIIPSGHEDDDDPRVPRGRRKRRGAAAESASSLGSVPHMFKRVSVEYPLALTRIEATKDATSSSTSTSSHPWWAMVGTSSSRRVLDIVTAGVPVTRTVSASLHCQAGMKGTRTGYSSADLELRYRPGPRAFSNPNGGTAINQETRTHRTSSIDATYTAGVSLTERPSLSAGATMVSMKAAGQSTTWSGKVTTPKLNLADGSFASSEWWKGLSCRFGWSKDVASFCTVRSSLVTTLPKPDKRRSGTSGIAATSSVLSLSSASLTLASRNTVHKWSAAMSWSPWNFSKSAVGTPSGSVGPTERVASSPTSSQSSLLSWMPRIALSLSPQLPKLLWDRTCHFSGWYSLSDASWSFVTSTSKACNGSHMSVGWTKTSSGSWTYLITLSLGSMVTIRIPVTVTAVMDPFWYPVQAGLVSVVSGLVQEAVSHVIASPSETSASNGGNTSAESDEARSLRRQRAKQLAQNQQVLMRRTAENRMLAERAKSSGAPQQQQQQQGGLVIDHAVYYTDRESWDVTVPLQFWVLDSALDIGPATKKDLLGFYDLSYRADPSPSQDDDWSRSWISGFWRLRRDDEASNGRSTESGSGARRRAASTSPASRLVTPNLKISYTYRGVSHEETFRDHDEILLPRPDVN